jgi:HPt (histidine-containing phosphotransfer) domain-containing protein
LPISELGRTFGSNLFIKGSVVMDQQMSRVIDWEKLSAQFRGREASVIKVATTILRTQADVPARLADLVEKRDYAGLSELAHTIKGMGGNLMANSVYELGMKTDQAARAQDENALELAKQLAMLMQNLLDEVRDEVRAKGG